MGANGQFESIMGHKFADDQKNGDDARATRVKKLADLCSKSKFNVYLFKKKKRNVVEIFISIHTHKSRPFPIGVRRDSRLL